MSLLWTIPPMAAAAVGAIMLILLRDMASAAAELSTQLRRLDEVRVAVASVRAESAQARASLQNLRSR